MPKFGLASRYRTGISHGSDRGAVAAWWRSPCGVPRLWFHPELAERHDAIGRHLGDFVCTEANSFENISSMFSQGRGVFRDLDVGGGKAEGWIEHFEAAACVTHLGKGAAMGKLRIFHDLPH